MTQTQDMAWWRLLGFVVMPNHYHLIVGLGEVKALSNAVGGVNKFTARRINLLLGRTGEFWEEGFYDHLIRARDDYDSILRYVHYNPVDAGLCSKPEDWPFSTASEKYAHLIDWDWIGISIPTLRIPKASWRSENIPSHYR